MLSNKINVFVRFGPQKWDFILINLSLTARYLHEIRIRRVEVGGEC